jgi:hypothetical protein
LLRKQLNILPNGTPSIPILTSVEQLRLRDYFLYYEERNTWRLLYAIEKDRRENASDRMEEDFVQDAEEIGISLIIVN